MNSVARILVVEDDPIMGRGLKNHLEGLGYEVTAVVTTGEEALAAAQRDAPQLALMDIELDGPMDGIEAAVRIRSALNIPIIFLTAHTEPHLIERAKATEPYAVLVKPCGKGELRMAIEIALHKAAAERALVMAKEEWELTFDTVPDSIIILDRDHRILRANRATCRLLGLEKQDLVGSSCFRLFHGTEAPPQFCPHAKLLSDGHPHSGEVYEAHLKKTLDVSASPLFDRNGGLMGSVHVARDVTERKIHEQRQAQLLREIRHFTYFVSHDLRAPLMNLRGFIKELEGAVGRIGSAVGVSQDKLSEEEKRQLQSALEEDIPEALYFIRIAWHRLNHLIDAILQLSRLEGTELKLERLDMNELAQKILTTLTHDIARKRVKVSIGALPDCVADRTAMEQIMGNLLDNAVKYLDPARPGRIEISGWREGEESVFRIKDNGVGIHEDDLERIFQVFRRLGTTDVPGEGMGLACVRILVRRHGGRIWCESEPGKGSLFTFSVSNRSVPDA